MIKYFSVKNFASFKDEVSFEADIGSKTQLETNKALVCYGANASGKTNFLKAITFLFWFMQKSFFQLNPKEEIPFDPFMLSNNETTKFYVEFIINDNLYKYTLEITKEKVIYEKLEKNRFKKPIYERKEQKIIVSRDISKDRIEKDLPENVSIISFLSRFESQKFAKEIESYKIVSNVSYSGLIDNKIKTEIKAKDIATILQKTEFKNEAIELLKIADTEIVDFKTVELDDKLKNEIIDKLSKDKNISDNDKEKIKNALLTDKFKELLFKHKSEKKSFDLPIEKESSGTQKLFIKSKDILSILKNGGIYIVDEIEANLHFKIVEYIISKFKISSNAQLICSSQCPTIIDSCFDAKTLWFVEKQEGVSELYCANDFEDLKKGFSLRKLYEIGRFGAVPKSFYPKD